MKRIIGDSFPLAWANIKATPKMPAAHVRQDLERIAGKAGILALVEFKWAYYWTVLARVLSMTVPGGRRRRPGKARWRTFPSIGRGIAAPVAGGQMFAWAGQRWKRVKSRTWVLHLGVAGISEDRRIRAVVLADRTTGLALKMTLLVTHNVVGGDNRGDSERRKAILDGDIAATVKAVRWAKRLGHPVVLMLDANIKPSSAVYRDFIRRVVTELNGRIVGTAGVEYVVLYQGSNGTRLIVEDDWIIGTDRLNTDHEVRGLTGHLEGPVPA